MARKDALIRLTARLLARRDVLRKTLSDDLDSFGRTSETTGVSDQGDCAVELANDEIRSQLVEIETRELAQVEHALLRIAIGACGRCESCNRKIPVTRLNALPYTTRCIKCRHQDEVRGRLAAPFRESGRSTDAFKQPIDDDLSDEHVTSHAIFSDLRRSSSSLLDKFIA